MFSLSEYTVSTKRLPKALLRRWPEHVNDVRPGGKPRSPLEVCHPRRPRQTLGGRVLRWPRGGGGGVAGAAVALRWVQLVAGRAGRSWAPSLVEE